MIELEKWSRAVLCFVSLIAMGVPHTTSAQTKVPLNKDHAPIQKGARVPGDLRQSMMAGMESVQKMTLSGDTDREFAMLMKIHHQGALQMGQLQFAQGASPEMKAIARQIIDTRTREVEHFEKWLASTAHPRMPNALTVAEDMKRSMLLGMEKAQRMPLSGDIDKDFAEMMKIHHQVAIDMAQLEIAHGESPEIKMMAKQIVTMQKKEIAQFDRWLARQK